MDIQYLLWLQDFRNSINDALTPFLEGLSYFAVFFLILIPIFYYWNVDKKKGLYSLVSFYIVMIFTPLLKLTVCAYRPWIRDSRILPAGDAITTATGYSFPSGHTTTAISLSGSMAVNTWKEKRTRWLSVIFIAICVLTPFSRNYLGVHTPQDVVVGTLTALFSMFLASKLFSYLDKHPEKENYFLLGGLLIICAGLLYISLKPYPMTLKDDGTLLVDPKVMMRDGYSDLGRTAGFIIGRFIEKKWVRFKATGFNVKGIILCAAGLIPFVLLDQYAGPAFVQLLGTHYGNLAFRCFQSIYAIALFPIVLKFFEKTGTAKVEGTVKV